MKTTLLISLHSKCISTLEIIEIAKKKQKRIIGQLARHQMTTFQNELKLWPLGRPYGKQFDSEENLSHDLSIVQAAIVRLMASHFKMVERIKAAMYEQSSIA